MSIIKDELSYLNDLILLLSQEDLDKELIDIYGQEIIDVGIRIKRNYGIARDKG